MKIETTKEIKEINEMNYNEITDEDKLDIKEGDIILIKEKDSNKWTIEFVTLLTYIGIYLNPDKDKLDGGGIILWPEYIKENHLNPKDLYGNTKFIHISHQNLLLLSGNMISLGEDGNS